MIKKEIVYRVIIMKVFKLFKLWKLEIISIIISILIDVIFHYNFIYKLLFFSLISLILYNKMKEYIKNDIYLIEKKLINKKFK